MCVCCRMLDGNNGVDVVDEHGRRLCIWPGHEHDGAMSLAGMLALPVAAAALFY